LSAITPEDLDRFLAEFIRSVRRKDGEYESSSLRSLLASVERHLKKNSYPVSIISDRQFELTRRCLQSKQKELEKAGRAITNIVILIAFIVFLLQIILLQQDIPRS